MSISALGAICATSARMTFGTWAARVAISATGIAGEAGTGAGVAVGARAGAGAGAAAGGTGLAAGCADAPPSG